MPDRKLRVFLCHASQDKPVVRELYKRLLAEGWIDPWMDEECLLPGQDWNLEIEKAVETSDLVIACVSNQSVSKEGYLQKELRLVLDVTMNMPEGAIFLIPLRLEDCEIPRRIRGWQWVNYFPTENRQSAYKRLLTSLKLRAEKVGVFVGAKPPDPLDAPPVLPTPVKETPPLKLETVSSIPDLDLYIPAEYAGVAFVPPPAIVPTWTFGDIEFVKVPHGEFLMGSIDDDKNADDTEKPQHKFDIPYDFLMARFPVTNSLYWKFAKQDINKIQNGEIFQNHPVTNVTWKNIQAFCDWLNREYGSSIPRGFVFRLPTEAEWEKAARGCDGRTYPWGDEFDSQRCNSSESGPGQTTPVGAYSLQGDSPFGCADMSGNVWELTATLANSIFKISYDGKRERLYKPYIYPYKRDNRENLRASEDSHRIARGGSFRKRADLVRPAVRSVTNMKYGVGNDVGFRVALAPALS